MSAEPIGAKGTVTVRGTRIEAALAPEPIDDVVAAEEPLEIRISGEPVVVTMRTPGHDRELVVGFLRAEGALDSLADLTSVAHCGRPGTEGYGNVIDVVPTAGGSLTRYTADRSGDRQTMVTSSCGVCGRRTIDDLLARMQRVDDGAPFSEAVLARALDAMGERQALFAATGGTHASCLVRRSGEIVAIHEDVGRHNAVDKVLGSRFLAGEAALGDYALLVSGRVSFEIVQKAACAGVGVVVAVSAATSLAVETARRAEIALVAFARSGRMTVYSRADRVSAGDAAV